MRFPAFWLLLLLPLLGRADGFAYGKAFSDLRETDQAAVIHLAPDSVTVDMYIAIDGIPAGQTVTYVLPFWHEPRDFTLDEMDGKTFRERYIQGIEEQLSKEKEEAALTSSSLMKYLLGGMLVTGPFAALYPIIGLFTMPVLHSSSSHISPYQVANTRSASAEIYRVEAKDLPALVAAAHMPAKYAETLRKYHTRYFAVMRLTGTAASAREPNEPVAGMHYHFRHPVPNGQRYTYTYPLGTGGAWSKPIVLTDIYARTSTGYTFSATAPIIGEQIPYHYLSRRVRGYYQKPDAPLEPSTASLLGAKSASTWKTVRCPTAWHRAYSGSNPTEDITFAFRRTPADRLYSIVWWGVGHGFFAILAFLIPVLAQVLAIRTYLYPRCKRVPDVRPFASVVKDYLVTSLLGAIVTMILTILGLALLGVGALLGLYFADKLWRSRLEQLVLPLSTKLVERTILCAMGYYVLLGVGFWQFLNWAEKVMRG